MGVNFAKQKRGRQPPELNIEQMELLTLAFPFHGSVFRLCGDHCNYNSSGVVLYVGGNYNQNQNHGAFYLNGNNGASNANANIGSHILVKGF